MKVSLNTNIAALTAQGQLGKIEKNLSSVFERLSTGLRINGPGDDPAGLAIADALAADSKVFAQGVRNVNDGLSLLAIADASVKQLSSVTVRLSELAEQAANGAYSNLQRRALDNEAQALSQEFSRIIQSTEFNDVNLLNGEGGSFTVQAAYSQIEASIGGDSGTGTFTGPTNIAAENQPRGIISADFNFDGLMDLAVASEGTSNEISIMLGTGGGSFGASTQYAVGTSPFGLTTSDFNGDGIFDIASADYTDDQVSILIGRGDGTFESPTSFTAGNGPFEITHDDFNGDGFIDLVTADELDNEIGVFLGNGDGTFGSRQSFTVGSTPRGVETGDFNGDGVVDIVASNSAGNNLSLLLGNGDGTFGAASTLTLTPASGPWAVAAADFNGDDVLDLVSAGSAAGVVDVLIGNGDGTFQSPAAYTTSTRTRGVVTGDLNGDGFIDIAAASDDPGTSAMNVLLNNGDGTFSASTNYPIAGAGPIAITTGDFDGDGVLDLATANYIGHTFSVFLGETSDGTAPLVPFSLLTAADARQALFAFTQKQDLLSQQRGEIGASQSRLESAAQSLLAIQENYIAAESRIRDVDIAQETAELVRLQILQQATVAVLGQANATGSTILQLLGV